MSHEQLTEKQKQDQQQFQQLFQQTFLQFTNQQQQLQQQQCMPSGYLPWYQQPQQIQQQQMQQQMPSTMPGMYQQQFGSVPHQQRPIHTNLQQFQSPVQFDPNLQQHQPPVHIDPLQFRSSPQTKTLDDIFVGVQDLQKGFGNMMQTEQVNNCVFKVDTVQKRLRKIIGTDQQPRDAESEASSGAAHTSGPKVKRLKGAQRADNPGSFALSLRQLHDSVDAMEHILTKDIHALVATHAQELKSLKSLKLGALVAGSDVTSEQFKSLTDELRRTLDEWILLNSSSSINEVLGQSMSMALNLFLADAEEKR
jgi:hypothetical protein